MESIIKNGLFMGAILIASSFALYFTDPSIFINARTWVLLMVLIVLMVKTGLDQRRLQEGVMSFGEAFRSMFMATAIGVFFCTVFEYLLFNFIDPGLIEIQREIALEALDKMSGFLGEDGYDMALERIEEQDFNTVGQSVMGYFMRLIAPNALFSALIALIIKRNHTGP